MSKDKKLTPELRFPEFVNEGKWDKKTLIDVADKKVKWSFTGGPFGSNLKASDYTSDGIRIIQLQNIGDGEFYDEYKIFTSEEKADELLSCNIYSGEIILSKMGDPVGRACIIPNFLERCVMASDGIRLVVDERNYSKYFVFSIINSKQIRKFIEKKATGSTRKRIGLDELKVTQLTIPKFEEQKKIATCLSSLDEMIVAYNQKLELLKDHKKGLMQGLFPRDGKKVPNYRFPEFRGGVEWNVSLLGDVAKFSSGGTPSKERLEYWSGTIPWISAASMHTYNIENSDSNITELAVANGAQVAKESTLLILVRGSMLYNRIPMGIALRDVAFNQDVKALTLVKEMNIHFLLYELIAFEIQLLNAVTATGIGAGKLDTNDLKEFVIYFPALDEQQKIVNCLSSLDELIQSQTQKIEQLKEHKKGLMQGLFPIMIK